MGFQIGKEKVTKTAAKMDDLEDADKQIKIIGQIIDLNMTSLQRKNLGIGTKLCLFKC